MSVLADWVVPIVSAGLGTLGFSLLFHICGVRLALSTLGGMLAWACYLLLLRLTGQELLSCALASALASLYAQGMARACKAPATMFSLSAVIPLIPGGALYGAMQQAVLGQWRQFGQQGLHALLLAASIALGLLVGTLIGRSLQLLSALGGRKR